MSLSPRLTATPNSSVSYNPGMAETFSWIPIEGAGRPLFAKAVYDISSPNQNGFVVTADTTTIYGNFNTIKTIVATVFSAISADNSSIPVLGTITFPANFVIEGPITGYKLTSGSVIAYKA